MNGGKISFEFRSNLSELGKLHRNLEELGKSLGMSKKAVFQIDLAIEEVLSNIILYGYTDKAEHWIKITIWDQNRTLNIRIEDDGIPFNPLEAEAPDLECSLEERQIGGLGCHIMKSLMDDIVYERLGNKNVLTMKKTIEDT
ncbi:MAG: ATP-binding protein [Deltaproteobacteria bacterium]|nr:ATP-binding protein [Deltaproteobacteria bacterium]